MCEDKIEALIVEPTINSGHAFVCFDTTESANYIQKMFDSNV